MPVHVMKAPAGSGKTISYIKRLAARATTELSEVYVPTIELAEEVKSKLDGLGTAHRVAVIKGRDQLDSHGQPLCRRHQLAAQLAKKGVSVYPTLCMKRTNYGVETCPHYDVCNYVGQFWHCNVQIYTHAYLPLERTMLDDTIPSVVVIDEDFTKGMVSAVEVPFALLRHVNLMPEFSGAVQPILSWAQSQDHALLLSDHHRMTASGRSWSDMASALRRQRLPISPSDKDTIIGPQVAMHQNARPVATLLEHLDEVLRRGLVPGAIDVDQTGLVVHHRQAIRRFGDLNAPDAPKVFIVDATISELVLRQCIPVHQFEEVRTPRNAVVLQCFDTVCSNRSLDLSKCTSQVDRLRAKDRLADVQSLVDEIAATGVQALVVGPTAVTGNPATNTQPKLAVPSNVHLAHFNALRGIDKWKDCEVLVLVGRNEPPVEAIENMARALFYDDPSPLQLTGVWESRSVAYDMTAGTNCGVVVTGHIDTRVHEVLMQLREAESIQALDRLRLIHNTEPKLLVLLSKLPLPGVAVDRLLSWSNLTRGDEFEQLYVQCGGVLPLNASWISAKTGKTDAAAKKAVQRLTKRGQSLLRLHMKAVSPFKAPTLGQFRLAAQKSWSKFWHGFRSVQDAQPALEAALDAKVTVRPIKS